MPTFYHLKLNRLLLMPTVTVIQIVTLYTHAKQKSIIGLTLTIMGYIRRRQHCVALLLAKKHESEATIDTGSPKPNS